MRVLVVILVAVAWVNVWAADDYERLSAKAERYVQFQEWNSAHAMYLLMTDKRPGDAKAYARAIVTGGLLDDDATQVELLELTQKRAISLDSIFSEVYNFSYETGESQEYEQFLCMVKNRQPWMARNINVRLLKYYDFRNDAANMVSVGKELLAGTPDNIGYLSIVARGYMLSGDFENGAITYERILTLTPADYDATVALANYFYMVWKDVEGTRSQMTDIEEKAVYYFRKANNLRSTPFIESKLTELLHQ